MTGDQINNFSRAPRFERSEFSMLSPESRQIYLTFPADSTFREEDVSNYFRFNYFSKQYNFMYLLWLFFLFLLPSSNLYKCWYLVSVFMVPCKM